MMDDVCPVSPADTKSDRGHVRGSLGKGSGVLLPGVKASFLAKDAFGLGEEIVPSSQLFLVDCV